MSRLLARALVASLALIAAPGAARAGEQPSPEEIAAVSVYVEQIPTASGPQSAGGVKPRKTTLPAPVHSALRREGGTDAAKLEEIATSSAYGAPQAKPRLPKRAKRAAGRARGRPVPEVPADIDSAGAVDGAEPGGRRLVGLAAALVVITGVAGGAAVARRRQR